MPRPVYPPTPGSSTDISGQDGTKHLDKLQMSFALPEPAMAVQDQQPTPTEEMPPSKPIAASYTQPSETVKSRRRSSTLQQKPPAAVKDQFALPPPPTRSRKIIQMKPRQQAPHAATGGSTTAAGKSSSAAAGKSTAAVPPTGETAAAGNKRKQPSATTAAGRKTARKTAHSLIERRRRFKMNEEFALLKSMIPACSGEMHKLAILQASVEYIQYLEGCVATLKAQRTLEAGCRDGKDVSAYTDEPFRPIDHSRDEDGEEEDDDDPSPDVEMEGSDIPSPALTATHPNSRSQQPSVSPVLLAQRHDSYSSASTGDYRQYEYAASASTSPAFGPQTYHYDYAHSAAGSALTSPALGPQQEGDREATAALLMLNQSDRRGTGGSAAGRGMSVRDLLSS
ncbi:helix-loop-helix DNA-binding domain-containing protein [Coniochaeta sp. 2T2.1]|nr:helix-loop-helix DNA-binding domain-containing protein [Coniochaeta sp. 2T2.1]